MSRRYKTTITNRNTLLFRYATKIRLQCWEKMLYIQWINNSVSLSLYLHIYSDVPWRRGGRVRCGGCEKMLHPLPLFRTVSDLCKIFLEKIPKCLSFGQSRFTQQAVVIFSCLTYHYDDNTKRYYTVNITTSSNTRMQLKLNHLVGLNLYFLTHPYFFGIGTPLHIYVYIV